jgi:predicted ribosome quality control (RQC) complex YloA/Tae2 family protein
MREVIDSEKHALTPAEQKHPWLAPKWVYKVTGRLRLSIDNLPYSSGPMRGTWADGRIQLVENCLGDFIVGLKVAAAAIKTHRQESEEWARRREEEREQREEQQRKAQEHKRKAECITELIQNWEEAERVRAFVKAMTECSAQLELSETSE